MPLRLFTIDLNIANINRISSQNKNFLYRLNTLKSSLVSALRDNFLKLAKKIKSEEHNLRNIKDEFEEDNEDLPTIEVLNQFSFKEIFHREDEVAYVAFRKAFALGLEDYLGGLTRRALGRFSRALQKGACAAQERRALFGAARLHGQLAL